MKLLVAHGADPHVPTSRAGRPDDARRCRASRRWRSRTSRASRPFPSGGPGIPPLQAAAGVGYGEGFAGNAHRFAPTGMLAAVKYLVEELRADVNAEDYDGNTALHHAAARGDVEMILYLVSKGADPKMVNREGQSTADMANGPVQRTQPFPEARDLLVKLGANNHNKCVSCSALARSGGARFVRAGMAARRFARAGTARSLRSRGRPRPRRYAASRRGHLRGERSEAEAIPGERSEPAGPIRAKQRSPLPRDREARGLRCASSARRRCDRSGRCRPP